MLVDLHNLCFCFLLSCFVFELKTRPIFVMVGSCILEILLSWLFLCMWHHCSFNLITKLSSMVHCLALKCSYQTMNSYPHRAHISPRHDVIFFPLLLQVDTKHLGHKFSFWTSFCIEINFTWLEHPNGNLLITL
jgi:hypothetical protein